MEKFVKNTASLQLNRLSYRIGYGVIKDLPSFQMVRLCTLALSSDMYSKDFIFIPDDDISFVGQKRRKFPSNLTITIETNGVSFVTL